jgi:membrane protease subunit HflC
MKNLAITILISLIVIVMALLCVTFQVRETESALVMTFGKPRDKGITKPNLYFKLPPPIQRVYKFDSRLKVFSPEMDETTTKGNVSVIVNTYVVWKIAEPLKYYNSFKAKTTEEVERALLGRIRSVQNNVIGNHYFSELVNSDNSKIQFGQIQTEMFEALKPSVLNDYGIEIRNLGIRQLKISEDNTEKVFARMAAERNRKTIDITAQGNAIATKINTDAESKKTELLAAAKARAKAIRGEGDAEAAKSYKMLESHPKLAMFLRDLEALKKILEERTTIVFSADAEPFRLLRELPDLSQEE